MESLLFGLGLGLAAGFSPGPLMALVISAVVERGLGAGLRVAAAPLVTDLPVIVASIWLLSHLPEVFLGCLSLVGGLFVVFLGVGTLRRARRPLPAAEGPPAASAGDLWRGAAVNLLSPHPWLFWLSAGGPQVVSLWRTSPARAIAFLGAFYFSLVGAKVAVAVLVAGGRRRLLQGRGFRQVMVACGVLLLGLGALLIFDGGRRLTWLG